MKWLYLAVAILAEIVATSALKSSDGFTRLLPSVVTTLGYVVSFYFLSLTLRGCRSASPTRSGRAWASCSSPSSARWSSNSTWTGRQ